MKKLLMLFAMLFVSVQFMLGQEAGVDPTTEFDYTQVFTSFAGFTALVPVIVEGLKKLIPSLKGIWIQLISWVIAIGVAMLAWGMDWGFFADLDWWMALLYGLGAGLAGNGFADAGFITWVISLFSGNKDQTKTV